MKCQPIRIYNEKLFNRFNNVRNSSGKPLPSKNVFKRGVHISYATLPDKTNIR